MQNPKFIKIPNSPAEGLRSHIEGLKESLLWEQAYREGIEEGVIWQDLDADERAEEIADSLADSALIQKDLDCAEEALGRAIAQ